MIKLYGIDTDAMMKNHRADIVEVRVLKETQKQVVIKDRYSTSTVKKSVLGEHRKYGYSFLTESEEETKKTLMKYLMHRRDGYEQTIKNAHDNLGILQLIKDKIGDKE